MYGAPPRERVFSTFCGPHTPDKSRFRKHGEEKEEKKKQNPGACLSINEPNVAVEVAVPMALLLRNVATLSTKS